MEPVFGCQKRVERRLTDLLTRCPLLRECQVTLNQTYELLKVTFSRGGKLLVCGNGGSAADALHLSGELLKGFQQKRPLARDLQARLTRLVPPQPDNWIQRLQGGLPVIALPGNVGVITAVVNDQDGELIFAQQVVSCGQSGDALLAISTSGNAANVLKAVWVAKAKGLPVVGLTGMGGGELREWCDICIRVPAEAAYLVQELHLPVYHTLALMLEETFFHSDAKPEAGS
jgi:D-sedoheptulose 7-phosphate isomerase